MKHLDYIPLNKHIKNYNKLKAKKKNILKERKYK